MKSGNRIKLYHGLFNQQYKQSLLLFFSQINVTLSLAAIVLSAIGGPT